MEDELYFIFQKNKYVLHQRTPAMEANTVSKDATSTSTPPPGVNVWFAPLGLPINLPLISYFQATSSPLSQHRAQRLQESFGRNVFDIPLPPFMDLFLEHAFAPFFVFQIFCVLLWCLDEYWYYSLMTLFMLVAFECTLVKRRLKNLEFLRSMRQQPYQVWVYRSGVTAGVGSGSQAGAGKQLQQSSSSKKCAYTCSWVPVQSSELVPGDLLSIVRPSNPDHLVPCDLLLLRGQVVVNESMLTGESVPQQKEGKEGGEKEEIHTRLNIESADMKRNLLYGGTKVLIHNASAGNSEPSLTTSAAAGGSTDDDDVSSPLSLRIRPPPDGGCIAFVLRTGFHTEQGKLVRTILYSSENVSVNNWESLAFIGVLLCFAIVASGYVAWHGLQDPEKSRYKLLLNCIMILTSVVPPELPMELSLAVNTSLLALMKHSIFCTEPFRIPLAGAVDLCAFDKTGTLTRDEFKVKGIAGVRKRKNKEQEEENKSSSNKDSGMNHNNTADDADSTDATDPNEPSLVVRPNALPMSVKYIIAGCHSLTVLPENVVKENSKTGASSSSSSSSAGNASSSSTSHLAHLIGDPLEKSSLAFIDWSISRSGEGASSRSGPPTRIRVVHKYPFSSSLKRMACVIALEQTPPRSSTMDEEMEHERATNLPSGCVPLRVVCKGAPEVLDFLPSSLPSNYTALHSYYSQQGCRVLALGWKDLPLADLPDDRRKVKSLSRADVESSLIFAGLLVLSCPLKEDSTQVIQHLQRSSHETIMISGDHMLTCCHVASEVGITHKPTCILQLAEESGQHGTGGTSSATDMSSTPKLIWKPNVVSSSSSFVSSIPFDWNFTPQSIEQLRTEYDLCITGQALECLNRAVHRKQKSKDPSSSSLADPSGTTPTLDLRRLCQLVRCCNVFARCSPSQKELIIHWLKLEGLTTLMCGDGSNDSGSLKQAHVGVAVLDEEAAKAFAKQMEKRKKEMMEKRKKAAAALGLRSNTVDTTGNKRTEINRIKLAQTQAHTSSGSSSGSASGSSSSVAQPPRNRLQQQLHDRLKKLEEEATEEENTLPRLGDASIASPFTSKTSSIACVLSILRQGRCTLVTTMQMFHILGVNCLLSAYAMSVLYLEGVKWGDSQMTIASLSIAMFFLFLSRSEPLQTLSRERPHRRLFSPYMLLSVLGQFAIHMFVLLYSINLSNPFRPMEEEHRSPDATFKPNVLNTVVFLVSTTQTAVTFAANYRGRPFMLSLSENRPLYNCIMLNLLLMFGLASEVAPGLNAQLELHPLPNEGAAAGFRTQLLGLLVLDCATTIVFAKMMRRIFAIKGKPALNANASQKKQKQKQIGTDTTERMAVTK